MNVNYQVRNEKLRTQQGGYHHRRVHVAAADDRGVASLVS